MSDGLIEQPSPSPAVAGLPELPPADFFDPVIEAYKKDVDRTLLRENLRLTVAERVEKFERGMRTVYELRRAGEKLRASQRANPRRNAIRSSAKSSASWRGTRYVSSSSGVWQPLRMDRREPRWMSMSSTRGTPRICTVWSRL